MRLFVELFVNDLSRARRFYAEAVGLRVIRDEETYVVLVGGDAQINLAPIDDLPDGHYLRTGAERLGTRVEFCLEVDDLEAAYKRAVAAGVEPYEPITERPWGRTDFRLVDPDGAYLRVTTPPHTPLSAPGHMRHRQTWPQQNVR